MDRLPASNAAEILNDPTLARPAQVDNLRADVQTKTTASPKKAKTKKAKKAVKSLESDAQVQGDAEAGQADDVADGAGASGDNSGAAAAGASHLTKSTMSGATEGGVAGVQFDNSGLAILSAFLLLPFAAAAGRGATATATATPTTTPTTTTPATTTPTTGTATDTAPVNVARKGLLIDSPVGGVDYYVNGALRGQTAADGTFTYTEGDVVTFKIGPVALGGAVTVNADGRVMMQDLAGVPRSQATDPRVVRLAQLLQSLDADNDPSNGISILADRLKDGLGDTEIEDDTVIKDLLDGDVKVVPMSDALDHLNNFSDVLKSMDDSAPSAVMTFDKELVATGQTAKVTLTFSEPIHTWIDLSEILTANGFGALSDLELSKDGMTLKATFTPQRNLANGAVTITLWDDYTDQSGNQGEDVSAQVNIDTAAPIVSLDLQAKTAVLDANAKTDGADISPSMTRLGGNGSYVTVWQGLSEQGGTAVFVQKFDAAGDAIGAPTQIASGAGSALPKVVPVGGDGAFLVSFAAQHGDGAPALNVQPFGANGLPTTKDPITVDGLGDTPLAGAMPQVVSLGADGAFAVMSQQSDDKGSIAIKVQRFDAMGAAEGLPVTVPADTGADEILPRAAMTPVGGDGAFALAWIGTNDVGAPALFTQAFDSTGIAKGTPAIVGNGTAAPSPKGTPRIVPMGTDGAYMALWQGANEKGDSVTFVQQFDAKGAKVTDAAQEIAALQGADLGHSAPSITALGDKGDFAIVWQTSNAKGIAEITAQKFGPDGLAIGAATTVNGTDTLDAGTTGPVITALGDKGDFAISWVGGSEARGSSIHVQRFNADGVADVIGDKVNATTLSSAGITLRSTETGAAFLVHSSIDMSLGLDALTEENANLWNSTSITKANADLTVPTSGMIDGQYRLYLVDANGNLSAAVERTVFIDQSRPTLTITDNKATGAANSAVTYTFTFSEAVKNFSAADIAVANGTKGELVAITEGEGAGRVFTMSVTPTAKAEGGDIGVSVDKNWTDAFDNAPDAVTNAAAQPFDTVAPEAPVVALSTDTGRLGTDLVTKTSGVTVTAEANATVEYWHSDISEWRNIAPAAVEGTNVVQVRQIDLGGNISGTATFKYTYDITAPVFTLALSSDTGSSATDKITSNAALKIASDETDVTTEYSGNGTTWTTSRPETVVGENTVYVRRTDVAGNVSAAQSITFTYDNAAVKPVLSLKEDTGQLADNTDGATRVSVVNVAGLETGSTWEYQIDGAGEWVAGTGTTLTAIEGAHSYKVRQTDAAGNIATSDAINVNLITSTANVAVQLVASENKAIAGFSTNEASAKLKVAAKEGDLVQYRFVNVGQTDAKWTDLNGTSVIDVAEGVHNIETRKYDNVGNFTSQVTRVYKDLSAATPTMTLLEDTGTKGDGLTMNPIAKIGGLEGGAVWQYRLDNSDVWNSSLEGPDKLRLELGTHTYHIRQTDRAGNVSAVGAYTFTYQSEVAQPTLTLAADTGVSAGDGITSNAQVNVGGLLDGATWQYKIGKGDWVDGTGTSFAMQQDGTAQTYTVRQQSGGKYSEPSTIYSMTFDNTAPGGLSVDLKVDSGTSATDGVTNNDVVNVSGLEVGGRLEYQIGTGAWRSLDATATTAAVNLDNGTNTYNFRQIDKAGNASATVTKTYTYISPDLSAPSLKLAGDTGRDNDGITSNAKIDVSLSVTGTGVTWQYEVDGSGNWVNGTGTSFNATSGAHSYRVRQIDVAGNTSPASAAMNVTLDTVAPGMSYYNTIKVADPDSEKAKVIPTDQVLFTAGAGDATAVTYSMTQNDALNLDAATGKITFKQPTGYVEGGTNTYSTTLTATDAAGNATERTLNFEVTRTNTGAPMINLGEYKTGTTAPGNRNGGFLFSDGTIALGTGTYINNVSATVPARKSIQGADLNGYKLPAGYQNASAWGVDGQDRVYIVLGYGKTPLNTLSYETWNTSLKVVRYSKDGVLDTSYGTNGAVDIAAPAGKGAYFADSNFTNSKIEISADGRVTLAFIEGTDGSPRVTVSSTQMRVVDISPAGAVQSDGLIPRGNMLSYLYALPNDLAQGAGGVAYVLGPDGFVHKMLNGAVDTAWNGGEGKRQIANFGDDNSLVVDGENRLIYIIKKDSNLELYRLNTNGSVDTSYGTSGVAKIALPSTNAQYGIDIDLATGKVFVLATTTTGDFVYQLLPNGSIDTSFGTGGFIQMSLSGTLNNGVRTVGAVQDIDFSNNKLFIYGEGEGTNQNGGITRVIDLVTQKLDDSYGKVVLTTNEGSRPIGLLTQRSFISDADLEGKTYDKVSLTISRTTGQTSDDIFGARGDLMMTGEGRLIWKGVDIGSVSNAGGRLSMVFNDKVTGEVLNDAMRAITYRNSNKFTTGAVQLNWTMSDNDAVGGKVTTSVQTINMRNDNSDVGDQTLVGKSNDQTIDFGSYFTAGGKKYYMTSGITRAQVDTFFNAGEDTTDTARTAVLETGVTMKLLTKAELTDLWARTDLAYHAQKSTLASVASASPFDVNVLTADLGTAAGTHTVFDLESAVNAFKSLADTTTGVTSYAYYEVIDTPDPQPDFVDPKIRLLIDNGDSNTDRLTSDGRFEVLGMNSSLPYDVSLDGGVTWATQGAGNMIFTAPEGRYEAGKIMVRQSDLSGFTETITSNALYKVDLTIKSLGLRNDQGLSLTDNITADGTIVANGIDASRPYEFSVNGGASWTTGGTLPSGQFGFVLAKGSYGLGQIRVRQTDGDGAVSTARNAVAYQIDPLVGQGNISLIWDNGESTTDGLTSYDHVKVTGLRAGLAIEFSTDGGTTWTAAPAPTSTIADIVVPEASYSAGGILVRQTDATGFVTEVTNSDVFKVDKTVKIVELYNDQGTSTYDKTTADARIVIKGFDAARAFEYSTDGGSTWKAGSLMNDELLVVTVPEGAYTANKLQARQTDANNITSYAKNTDTLVVSATKGQGSFVMGFDSGPSNSDGVTNYSIFYFNGVRDKLDWDYSLDNGQNWTAGTKTAGFYQNIKLPDGIYAVGAIQVRQTDALGYTSYVKNSTAYTVDSGIATVAISLKADTGYSNEDYITADGRVAIDLTGTVGPDDLVQYSMDAGSTWTQAGNGSQVITLPNGSYGWGAIRVKVSDTAGNNTVAVLWKELRVDNSDTTAPVINSPSKVFVVDWDGTGTKFSASAYSTVATVQTTDANKVIYSLEGEHAALFNVYDNGKIFLKTSTQLVNPLGDVYKVKVKAQDVFGNASVQDIEVNIVAKFGVESKTVDSVYSTIDQGTYEMVFTHNIALVSGGTIKLVSPSGKFADVVFDMADASRVRVDGTKLILNIANLNLPGQYELKLDNAVKSVTTGDVWKAGDWDRLGFSINKTVEFSSGEVNVAGSFVTKSIDGVTTQGTSVIVGDVNGDGIDDFAVSAADADKSGVTDIGAVYVVYGRTDGVKTSLSDAANGIGGYMILGANSGAQAGAMVSSAGDVNGDGYGDLAVFSSGPNGGHGKGYVVYGQKSASNVSLMNVEHDSSLGRAYSNNVKDAFAGVGDVNGDGFDDIGHGRVDLQRTTVLKTVTKTYDTYQTKGVITEKADWLNFVMDWVEVASKIASFFDDPFTATIETAAEWEDNLDLVMGTGDEDGGEDNPLGEAMKSVILQVKNSLPAGQTLEGMSYSKTGGGGNLLTGAKDTVHTLTFTIKREVVTTTTLTTTLFGAGEATIELGNAGVKQITGTINGQQVGSDTVALGDINGDGRADFGVLDTGSGGVLARANIVFGSKSTEELFTNNFDSNVGGFRILDPARTTEYVGEGSITGIGDFNGDGINDFTVVLDAYEAPTYVVYGRAGMTSVDLGQVAAGNGGFMLEKASKWGHYQVEAIGDFNGDGLDDLAYHFSGQGKASSIQVVFGGTGKPASLDGDALGLAGRGFEIDMSGMVSADDTDSVSSGDINGDGLSDLMIRAANGDTVVVMGSATTSKFSQVKVDQMGTTGDDTLTSTGQNLLVGGLGNDSVTTSGADVVLAGAGDDRVVVGASMATALQNVFGAGGNTTQLAKIEGGAGWDILQLSGGANLDFRNISNKMLDMDNISGRVSGIEKFDLATDASANKLTLEMKDVLEMGVNNAVNTQKGWGNVSGAELSALVAKAQLVVDAGTNDRVELRSTEWFKAGTVVDNATNQQYDAYGSRNGEAAQLLIDRDAVLGWV